MRLNKLLALAKEAADAHAKIPPEGACNPAWGPMADHWEKCSFKVRDAIAALPEEERLILVQLYGPLRKWWYR
jgi:hypothetical protein